MWVNTRGTSLRSWIAWRACLAEISRLRCVRRFLVLRLSSPRRLLLICNNMFHENQGWLRTMLYATLWHPSSNPLWCSLCSPFRWAIRYRSYGNFRLFLTGEGDQRLAPIGTQRRCQGQTPRPLRVCIGLRSTLPWSFAPPQIKPGKSESPVQQYRRGEPQN